MYCICMCIYMCAKLPEGVKREEIRRCLQKLSNCSCCIIRVVHSTLQLQDEHFLTLSSFLQLKASNLALKCAHITALRFVCMLLMSCVRFIHNVFIPSVMCVRARLFLHRFVSVINLEIKTSLPSCFHASS